MRYLRMLKNYGPVRAGTVEQFEDGIAARLIEDGTAKPAEPAAVEQIHQAVLESSKSMEAPPMDRQAKGYARK